MDLVRDQVVQFHHVDQADHDALVERFARPAVQQEGLAVLVQLRLLEEVADLGLADPVKYGGRHVEAEGPGRDSQMGLQHLADVHTRRHAERVQDDVDRGAVRKVRHVFLGNDLGDDALVPVAAGHLVADGNLPLGGNIDFHLFDDPGVDVLTGLDALQLHIFLVGQLVELLFEARDDLADFDPDRAGIDLDVVVHVGDLPQQRLGDLAVGRDDDFTGFRVDHVERDLLVEQDVGEGLGQLLLQLRMLLDELVLDSLGVLLRLARGQLDGVLLQTAAGDLHVHDDAGGAGRHHQGAVLHVRSLLTENCAQQALFGS